MKITLAIEGMMCEHCKSTVENALKSVDKVDSVKVNLKKKTAVIKADDSVTADILNAAVKDAGYDSKTV